MLTSALLAAAALGAAGCGDDDETASSAPAETAPATTTTAKSPRVASSALRAAISKDLNAKPSIPRPTGDAPRRLHVRDIVKGNGRTAKAGDTLSVQYIGVSYSTGQQFDASWDRGEPFSFPLGAQMVIPGWDQGLEGMRVGGRRQLIIPSNLAYGAAGAPPDIAPNETLIFVIDLLSAARG